MAGAKSKKLEEKVETVDLAPMQKEIDSLKSELSSLKKEMVECKKCCSAKQSSGGTSALAQQLVDALKEMTGPNTKGVRNYVRSIFK